MRKLISWVHLWLFYWKCLNSLWTGLDFFFLSCIPVYKIFQKWFLFSGEGEVIVEGKWSFSWIFPIIRLVPWLHKRSLHLPQTLFTCLLNLTTLNWWSLQSRSILYMEDYKCLLHALIFLLPLPVTARFYKAINHLFLKNHNSQHFIFSPPSFIWPIHFLNTFESRYWGSRFCLLFNNCVTWCF